ncbi:DUF7948 domain-containing protein [Taibaiella koreensis]|uniref:DUF7948 domain-containing protein n=1 Tax=Taibaiella koreensis TaxID=1268548 RepID=UPI000E59F095|nr:gliding motility-associated C-terminal domain-containing protein [Taibaiella koreensis]
MKRLVYLCLFGLLATGLNAKDGNIDFIKNNNQFPAPVRYKAFLPGGAVFLTADGFTYNYYRQDDLQRLHELRHQGKNISGEQVHFHAYKVTFSNANTQAIIKEEDLQPYYHNYFIGNDPQHWAGKVPLYKKITWQNLYPGIDAIVYSKEKSLKYDFYVQPGADPSQVILTFDGVKPKLMKDGSLKISTTVNTLLEQAPYAYQLIDGEEKAVPCHYRLLPGNRVSFALPAGYDKNLPLVIDPVLVFSTFSGSTANTYGFSATYDLGGNLYAGGECFDVGWPANPGATQAAFAGSVDAGINKYSSNGTTLLYSTYYGGSGRDLPNNMMATAGQELVICGSTSSNDLATSIGCYDNTYNGNTDIYIARFSQDGTILKAATYLGGSDNDGLNSFGLSPNYGDENRGEVLTAPDGRIYIAGSTSSANFPITAGALQPTLGGGQDGVVCRLDSSLSVLQYSTFIGGNNDDAAFSLVLNSNNDIAICGGTQSANFPTTAGTLHTAYQGNTDGFVSIINTSTGLVRSSFLGTNVYDHAFKIQNDASDNIYVMGQTNGAYPTTTGVFSVTDGDIFITKLNPTLSSILLSTRMGNTVNFSRFVPTAFMHDICGNTYLSGFGANSNQPLSTGAYQTIQGSFWLGALSPDFTNLLYGTYFGPLGTHVDGGTSRFDPQGIIYHSACTNNSGFPTTAGVVFPVKLNSAINYDIASYKFNMEVGAVVADFVLANHAKDTGCADYEVTFDNLSTGASNYLWDFGDGLTSTATAPTHTFSAGTYTVSLVASRATGCNLHDTAMHQIVVKPTDKPLLVLNDTFLCDPHPVTLFAPVSNLSSNMHFHWEPASAVTSGADQQRVTVDPSRSTSFTVHVGNSSTATCVDSATGNIHIALFDYSHMYALPLDTTICPGDTLMMRAYGGSSYEWTPDETIDRTDASQAWIWPSHKIDYKVHILNDSGCAIDRTVMIKMLPPALVDAGLDQDIKRGESTQLDGRASGAFIWTPAGSVSPDNMLNAPVAPEKTTTYYLRSISPEGCRAVDSVTIHVTNALLPNAFSPNGDGNNDIFRLVPQDERVRLKDFSVYNRFGQRVFFTRDVTEGWDGSFNGKPADLGTYFYQVHYIIGARTYKLKGDVTLIR